MFSFVENAKFLGTVTFGATLAVDRWYADKQESNDDVFKLDMYTTLKKCIPVSTNMFLQSTGTFGSGEFLVMIIAHSLLLKTYLRS